MLVYDANNSLSQNFYIGATGSASLGTATAGSNVRVAVGMGATSSSGSMNGGAIQTVNATLGTPNRMSIGTESAVSNPLNSTIKKIAYYPVRLANATLQSLTA